MTHIYRSRKTGEKLVSVTTVLPDFPWGNEEAKARGTYVHRACHLINQGRLNRETVDPDYEPYIRAYDLLLKETGYQVEESEMVVESQRYKIAGTLDSIGVLDGKRVLVDLKSGEYTKKLPYWECQLSAYAELYKETTGDKRKRERWVFVLRSDGTYRMFQCDRVDAFTAFLSYLRIYRWEKSWK